MKRTNHNLKKTNGSHQESKADPLRADPLRVNSLKIKSISKQKTLLSLLALLLCLCALILTMCRNSGFVEIVDLPLEIQKGELFSVHILSSENQMDGKLSARIRCIKGQGSAVFYPENESLVCINTHWAELTIKGLSESSMQTNMVIEVFVGTNVFEYSKFSVVGESDIGFLSATRFAEQAIKGFITTDPKGSICVDYAASERGDSEYIVTFLNLPLNDSIVPPYSARITLNSKNGKVTNFQSY